MAWTTVVMVAVTVVWNIHKQLVMFQVKFDLHKEIIGLRLLIKLLQIFSYFSGHS